MQQLVFDHIFIREDGKLRECAATVTDDAVIVRRDLASGTFKHVRRLLKDMCGVDVRPDLLKQPRCRQ